MAIYRVYHSTKDGRRFAADDFEALTDDDAIEHARTLAVLRVPIFEVWDGDRLVYRLGEAKLIALAVQQFFKLDRQGLACGEHRERIIRARKVSEEVFTFWTSRSKVNL